MAKENSQIAEARLTSALTLGDASMITGLSSSVYEHQEEHPLEFSLGELRALSSELNSDGKRILREWVLTFFGL